MVTFNLHSTEQRSSSASHLYICILFYRALFRNIIMQGVIHVQKIKNKGGGVLVNALPLSSSSPCS